MNTHTVEWVTNSSNQHFPLLDLNLSSPYFANRSGVYIIWHGGQNASVVRVGQGVINDRLGQHKTDPAILAYRPYGLFVTWTELPIAYMDGVERYLAETWKPKVGDRFPNVLPIAVNSPW